MHDCTTPPSPGPPSHSLILIKKSIGDCHRSVRTHKQKWEVAVPLVPNQSDCNDRQLADKNELDQRHWQFGSPKPKRAQPETWWSKLPLKINHR